jgi:hypothetical protein
VSAEGTIKFISDGYLSDLGSFKSTSLLSSITVDGTIKDTSMRSQLTPAGQLAPGASHSSLDTATVVSVEAAQTTALPTRITSSIRPAAQDPSSALPGIKTTNVAEVSMAYRLNDYFSTKGLSSLLVLSLVALVSLFRL